MECGSGEVDVGAFHFDECSGVGDVGVDSFCGAVDGDGFFVVYEFGGVGCSEEGEEVAEVGLCVLGFVGVCGVVCDELLWCHGWGCFWLFLG